MEGVESQDRGKSRPEIIRFRKENQDQSKSVPFVQNKKKAPTQEGSGLNVRNNRNEDGVCGLIHQLLAQTVLSFLTRLY